MKIANAGLVPSDANLLPAYGSFTELKEACAEFCAVSTGGCTGDRRGPGGPAGC